MLTHGGSQVICDEFRYFAPTSSPSSCSALSSNFNPAAATFSSRCSTLEVPGIGSITVDRANSHATATWDGVARKRSATRLIALPRRLISPPPAETTE